MAEEKRTTVIDFQIQEGEALNSLAATKKAVVDLKKEQTELNKAIKEGTGDVDANVKSLVQVEAQLKKQQASYNSLQKTVTGLKSPFDKLNESIKEQAKQVTVAGVSLSTFANPATATVGILGALFKAYSSSTIGAKDLTFASNQLSFATNQLGNSLAKLIGNGEEGQGFFSILATSVIAAISGFDNAMQGVVQAGLIEKLEDLQRERLKVQAENNQRTQENLTIMEKLADTQVSINEKQQLGVQAVTNIAINRDGLLKIAEQELQILNDQNAALGGSDKILDAIKLKTLEISSLRLDAEAATSRIDKAESNILDAKTKQAEQETELSVKKREKQLETDNAYFEEVITLELEHDIRLAEARQAEIDAEQAKHDTMLEGMKAWLKNSEAIVKKRSVAFGKSEKDNTRIAQLEEQSRLLIISNSLGQAQGLFEKNTVAYKFLGVARATIDTYQAASLALATYPPPIGAIAAAVNIALGLANVAKILDVDVSAAAGGGSFYTKGPQLLMVGDNPGGVERVDVSPVSGRGKTIVGKNMVQMAGGGTMFTDASIAAGAQFQQQQQAIAVNLVYSEFREFVDGVQFKELRAEA